MKIPKKKLQLPAPRVPTTPTAKVVVPTTRVYRIQTQRLDTRYPQIWYDLMQGTEIFETGHLVDAVKVRDAFKTSSTKLRYRVIQIMEVDA